MTCPFALFFIILGAKLFIKNGNKTEAKENPVSHWCATRQEDSEKSKSSVPPVVYTAGGILMPPDSTVHDTQLVSSDADSAESALCYSN